MSRDARRFLEYLDAERKAALLYTALAETVEGERREAFLELATIEQDHAVHWVERLEAYGIDIPPAPTMLDPEDLATVRRAKAAGLGAVLEELERVEGATSGIYDDEPEAPAGMAIDERKHAEAFRRMRLAPEAPEPKGANGPAAGTVDFGEGWHKTDRSGAVRAAVFGISDGLVSNTALVMGFAGGSNSSVGPVLFAGLAGLLAGAFSMAAGEYVSVASQRDLFAREIAMEANELATKPDEERRELELIYRAKGLDKETARITADRIMSNPKTALDTLAREELGLDPDSLGSPIKVALSSFTAFAVGALVVVIPFLLAWFIPAMGFTAALIGGIVLAVAAMATVGGLVGKFSGRGIVVGALRQLLVGGGAATVTFLLGRLVGSGLA